MSESSKFWAQRPKDLVDDARPSATAAEPQKSTSMTTTHKITSPMVLRPYVGQAASIDPTPPTPVTALSWADQVCDEEEQALTAASSKRLQQGDGLQAVVDEQRTRIEELEDIVSKQARQIEMMNEKVQEKEARIVDLEAAAAKQDSLLCELEEQLAEQNGLAKEKATSIRSSQSATDVEDAEFVSEPATLPGTPTEDTSEVGLTQAATASLKFPELVGVNFPELPSPAHGLPSPRAPTTLGPIYVTKENIKQGPPVPPAPKLKLAIDTSKFAKKPTSPPKPSFEGVPDIDPSKDMRRMSKAEREPLGTGPIIQIVMGNEVVATLPKYMFMQCSYKAFEHWAHNPDAKAIRFDAGAMNKNALNEHVEWMIMHTHCARVYSIHIGKDDDHRYNLERTQASRVLGLNNIYVGHFTRKYCDSMRNETLQDDVMSLIVELAHPDNDPIFDCLANCMLSALSRTHQKDREVLEHKIQRLPKLAAKIQEVKSRKKQAKGGKVR